MNGEEQRLTNRIAVVASIYIAAVLVISLAVLGHPGDLQASLIILSITVFIGLILLVWMLKQGGKIERLKNAKNGSTPPVDEVEPDEKVTDE